MDCNNARVPILNECHTGKDEIGLSASRLLLNKVWYSMGGRGEGDLWSLDTYGLCNIVKGSKDESQDKPIKFEMLSSATTENPHPSIDQLFTFHKMLAQLLTISKALAKCRASSKHDDSENSDILNNHFINICAEKEKNAAQLVRLPLATDLTSISILGNYIHKISNSKEATKFKAINNNLNTTLDDSTVTQMPKNQASSRKSSHVTLDNKIVGKSTSTSAFETTSDKKPSKCHSLGTAFGTKSAKASCKFSPEPSSKEPTMIWVKGNGVNDIVELSKLLHKEATNWFLEFIESALDARFHTSKEKENDIADSKAKGQLQQDKSQIEAMLSQLKKANDWLDLLGKNQGDDER